MAFRDEVRPLRRCCTLVHNSYYGHNTVEGLNVKTMSAKDAKNTFGLLLDNARAEPVTVEKHGRAVVVVMSVEEYERLHARDAASDQGTRAA